VILNLSWHLPRTPATVTLLRRVLDSALQGLGITEECRYDLVLALAEACANAVEHARVGWDYRVLIAADHQHCSIEVIDSGVGLDPVDRHRPMLDAANGHRAVSEHQAANEHRGRGLKIIEACTDSMAIEAVEPHGLAIRFQKRLTWEPGASGRFTIPAA
jgi:serine/threonine-protein kinase RsbW